MLRSSHDTFFGLSCPYGQADIVLFGAPFDSTTSFRPGARFAPRAMRTDSVGLESYSPYQDLDLLDYPVCDAGDLELSIGNTQKTLEAIEQQTATILRGGKLPFMLGGEHLVTLGAVRAAVKRYPGLHVLHLDAHTDLRDDYLGEPLSHATVMRRIWELVGDGAIHQFGIRSGEREEFLFAQAHTDLHRFTLGGFAETVRALRGLPVYLSVDLDVLDPSVFPGTGTPEAGGVGFPELLDALRCVGGLDIVGCDLVELSPPYDASGVSTAVANKLLRELLLTLTTPTGTGQEDE